MKKIKIVTISLPIIWENKEANFALCNQIFEQIFSNDFCSQNNIIPNETVVILPEMFSCGFTMNTGMAEEHSDTIINKCPDNINKTDEQYAPSICWLKKTASKYNCAIMASVPVKVKDLFYNRAMFITPDSNTSYYDKKHLFRMGDEGKHYSSGKKIVTAKWHDIRFRLNICYDLRFPVWSRNSFGTENEYDVLLNCASFPSSRASVIEPLVKARAIENMSYAVFVNRSGEDPTLSYCNSSYIIDYKGNSCSKEILLNIPSLANSIQVLVSDIDIDNMNLFREKFPAYLDADRFKIF